MDRAPKAAILAWKGLAGGLGLRESAFVKRAWRLLSIMGPAGGQSGHFPLALGALMTDIQSAMI
jgi:hypothetical protein